MDVHSLMFFLLLGVIYANVQNPDEYNIVNVRPECGNDDLGYALINVTFGSGMVTELLADCANGAFNFTRVADLSFYIGVSYFPSSICSFNKRKDDKVYTINLIGSYGDNFLEQETLEYTITCTFSPKANSYTSGQHVVEGLIAPIELQTHNGPVSDVPIIIQMTDVSGNNLSYQYVHLGRPVQLTLEASDVLPNRAVGIVPTACDAIGLSSGRRYAVLRAGCGDGLIFQKEAGFTTEGLISKSPYFYAFGIGRDIRLKFKCNVTICYSPCDGSSCISEKRKRSSHAEQADDTSSVVSVAMEWSLSKPNHRMNSNINTTSEASITPIVSVSSKDIDMLDDTIVDAIPKAISDSAIMPNDVPNHYIYGKTISDQDLSSDEGEDDLPIEKLYQKLVELAKVLSTDDFDKLEEVMSAGRLPRNRRTERGTHLQQDGAPAPRFIERARLGKISRSGLIKLLAANVIGDGNARDITPDVESTLVLPSNDLTQPYPDGPSSGQQSLTDQRTSVADVFHRTALIMPSPVFDRSVPEIKTSTDDGYSIEKRHSHKHEVFFPSGIPLLPDDLFHDKLIPIGHVKEHKSHGNRTHSKDSPSSEIREIREATHTEGGRVVRGDNYDGGVTAVDVTEARAKRDKTQLAGDVRGDERLLELVHNVIAGLPSEEEPVGVDLTNEDIPVVMKATHTDDRQKDKHITDDHELYEMADNAGENIVDGSVQDVHLYEQMKTHSDGDMLGEAVFMNTHQGELYEDDVENQTPGWLADIFRDIELHNVTNDGVRPTDIRWVETTSNGNDIATRNTHNTEVNRNTDPDTKDTDTTIHRNTDVDTTLNGITADTKFTDVGTRGHRNTGHEATTYVDQSAINNLSGEYEDDWLLTLHADVPEENNDGYDPFTLLSNAYAGLAVIDPLTGSHLSDSTDHYTSEKRFEEVSGEVETVKTPFLGVILSQEQLSNTSENKSLLELEAGSDALFEKSVSAKGDAPIGNYVYAPETANVDAGTSVKGPLSKVLIQQTLRVRHSEMVLQPSEFAASTIIIVNLSILTFLSIAVVAFWIAILCLAPLWRRGYDVERCQ